MEDGVKTGRQKGETGETGKMRPTVGGMHDGWRMELKQADGRERRVR